MTGARVASSNSWNLVGRMVDAIVEPAREWIVTNERQQVAEIGDLVPLQSARDAIAAPTCMLGGVARTGLGISQALAHPADTAFAIAEFGPPGMLYRAGRALLQDETPAHAWQSAIAPISSMAASLARPFVEGDACGIARAYGEIVVPIALSSGLAASRALSAPAVASEATTATVANPVASASITPVAAVTPSATPAALGSVLEQRAAHISDITRQMDRVTMAMGPVRSAEGAVSIAERNLSTIRATIDRVQYWATAEERALLDARLGFAQTSLGIAQAGLQSTQVAFRAANAALLQARRAAGMHF